jgi:Cellulose binding domain
VTNGGVLNYLAAVEPLADAPRRAEEPAPGETRTVRHGAATPRRPESRQDSRRKWLLSSAGVLAAALVAALLLWAAVASHPSSDPVTLPPPRHASPPVPTPATPTPTLGIAAQPLPSLAQIAIPAPGQLALPSALDTASIAAAAPPPPPAAGGGAPPTKTAPPPFTATYTTTGLPLGLLGYHVTVTVTNPATVAQTGWQVVFQLPSGETAANTNGANYQPTGTAATFTPTDAGTVAAQGKAQFTFDVQGVIAPSPTGCTINGRPCS